MSQQSSLWRRPWRLLVLAAAVCAVFGVAPAISSAKKVRPLKVVTGSTVPDPVSWALYVALQKGYFGAEGLNPIIATASSGTAALSEITSGQEEVDFAASEALPAADAAGANLVDFFSVGYRPTWNLTFFGSTKKQSVSSLKGKPVGVFSSSSASLPLLAGDLAEFGLTTSDITEIPVGGPQTSLAAVQSGQIKAEEMTLEYAAFFKAAHIPFYEQILPKLEGGYPGMAALTSWATLETQKPVLEGFARAIVKAENYCAKNLTGCTTAYRKAVPSADSTSTSLLKAEIKINVAADGLVPKFTHGIYGVMDAAIWKTMENIQATAHVITKKVNPDLMYSNVIPDALKLKLVH